MLEEVGWSDREKLVREVGLSTGWRAGEKLVGEVGRSLVERKVKVG